MVGTGDLSELALGWCTYNGDHMSMYHVNAGVPKTLVRYLVEWAAEAEFSGETSAVLHDICATPITPELLPLGADGDAGAEDRGHHRPLRAARFLPVSTPCATSSRRARSFSWRARRSATTTTRRRSCAGWSVFYRRFFSQQFKRSAMPDGPKVGSVALSPRGDWRMPSDASGALWLAEVETVEADWRERTNRMGAGETGVQR